MQYYVREYSLNGRVIAKGLARFCIETTYTSSSVFKSGPASIAVSSLHGWIGEGHHHSGNFWLNQFSFYFLLLCPICSLHASCSFIIWETPFCNYTVSGILTLLRDFKFFMWFFYLCFKLIKLWYISLALANGLYVWFNNEKKEVDRSLEKDRVISLELHYE